MRHFSKDQDLLHAQVTQHSFVVVELFQSDVEAWLFLGGAALDGLAQVLAVSSLNLFNGEVLVVFLELRKLLGEACV